jgi:hypothetical protein
MPTKPRKNDLSRVFVQSSANFNDLFISLTLQDHYSLIFYWVFVRILCLLMKVLTAQRRVGHEKDTVLFTKLMESRLRKSSAK